MISIVEATEYLGYDDIDTRHKEVVKVTKQDIIKYAKKIKLDTTYLLEGAKNERKEN